MGVAVPDLEGNMDYAFRNCTSILANGGSVERVTRNRVR
jgi:hypothetical protein